MRLSYQFAIIILTFGLLGCGPFTIGPSTYEHTDPTENVTGPGRITGTLTIRTPVIKVGSTADALTSCAVYTCPLDAHLYFAGGDLPARFQYTALQDWTSADPANGIYTMQLAYDDLPYGTYEIRFGSWQVHLPSQVAAEEYPYYYTHRVLLSDEPVTLSADAPEVTGRQLELDLRGTDGTVSGRILYGGWGGVSDNRLLDLQPITDTMWDFSSRQIQTESLGFGWQLPQIDLPDGRLYYEISGLPWREYRFMNPRSAIYYAEEYESFELSVEHPAACQLLEGHNHPTLYESDIDTNSLEGLLYFTDAQAWDGDLMVIARCVDQTGRFYQARQWLRQDKLAEESDSAEYASDLPAQQRVNVSGAIPLYIGPLRPGSYELSAVLLAADGQRHELAVTGGPYALPSSIVPDNYNYIAGQLYPWQTSIMAELVLTPAQAGQSEE